MLKTRTKHSNYVDRNSNIQIHKLLKDDCLIFNSVQSLFNSKPYIIASFYISTLAKFVIN